MNMHRIARVVTLLSLLLSMTIPSMSLANECRNSLNHFLTGHEFLETAKSIASRGYVAPDAMMTEIIKPQALDHGLVHWGLKIFVAESLEAARAHDNEIQNLLMKGVYLISSTPYPQQTEGLSESLQIFEKSSADHFYWFQEGVPQKINSETAQKYFSFNDHSFRFDSTNPQNSFLYQEGWFFPTSRGIILFEELKTSSSIIKYAQQIYDAGYTISFSKHFNEALDMLRNQVRKDQTQATNRYGNKGDDQSQTMQNILNLFQQGKAFSVEVVDPSGRLVAGNVSFLRKNFVTSDTVFYDTEAVPPADVKVSKEAVKPINLAKIANWVLSERLAQAGVPFYDIGMVSGFSSQTRGKLISQDEFLNLTNINNEDEILSINLKDDWIPPARR